MSANDLLIKARLGEIRPRRFAIFFSYRLISLMLPNRGALRLEEAETSE